MAKIRGRVSQTILAKRRRGGGKFHVLGSGDVKIAWRQPPGVSPDVIERKIDRILDQHPPGTPLVDVERALAKEGARFKPWMDGEPGHSDIWTRPGRGMGTAQAKLRALGPEPRRPMVRTSDGRLVNDYSKEAGPAWTAYNRWHFARERILAEAGAPGYEGTLSRAPEPGAIEKIVADGVALGLGVVAGRAANASFPEGVDVGPVNVPASAVLGVGEVVAGVALKKAFGMKRMGRGLIVAGVGSGLASFGGTKRARGT
jgi:hypothetical protein